MTQQAARKSPGPQIELQLALAVAGVVLVVLSIFAWDAYSAIRRSTLATADAHFGQAARQLVAALEATRPKPSATVVQTAADSRIIKATLTRQDSGGRARAALSELLARDTSLRAGELWSGGRRVAAVGMAIPPLDSTALQAIEQSTDSTGVGLSPFRLSGGMLMVGTAIPIGATSSHARLIVWRRVSSSRDGTQPFAGLVGPDASLLVGNARGDLWTDLTAPRPGPPVPEGGLPRNLDYQRPSPDSRWMIARSAPIPGTPWAVVVEQPRDVVLASARRFAVRIAIVGLLVIGGGAIAAWLVGRRVTRPLRAQIQAPLRLAEERFHAAVESAPSGMLMVHRDGKIVLANREAERLFGYGRDELLGHPVELLVPERFRGKHPRFRKDFFSDPQIRAMGAGRDLYGVRKDGKEIPVEIGLNPLETTEGLFVLASVVDITARKRVEQALRERDEQFHQLADNMKEVFFLQDIEHRRTLYINKAYEEIWGRSCQSLYENPESFIDPIPEEDRSALFASIERNRQGEYAGDVEFRVVRPDGNVRWVLAHAVPVRNEAGQVFRLAGAVLDITERKQAEERARSLFENSPLPMWVYDRETLRFLAVNNAATVEYGYTRDEFLQLSIEQLRPAEDVPQLRAFLADHGEEGYRRAGLWRHRRKDGSEVLVELSAHDLTFADRSARLVTINDVTVRVRTERIQAATYRIADAAHAAADLHELLRSVHEIVASLMPAKSFYIALYDERSDLITFPYFVDEKDPPPPPRHPGRGITDHVLRTGQPLLVTPEMRIEGEESVGTPSQYWLGVPLKAGERTIGVLAVQTYTPGVHYVEGNKDMLQFVSTQIATAIERKRAEETRRQSEERFRALVERSGDAIALLDRTGTITYASPSTAAVLGRPPESVVGANAFALLHPDDVVDVRRTLATMRGHPGAVIPVHSRFLHGDGKWHEGEGTITNRLDDPAVGAVVFNYRDVTERVQLESQLRQAQKMEAIGRLAGGVAHDFNNVLTAVFGYVDLLREELPPGSRAHEDLAEVRKAAERAAGLTRQLLAFSRQQVLEPVVLEINDLVADFEKMLRRVIGEDVELRLALGEKVGNVRADPGQLQQVLMNLIVNARDAMPHGGKLILETANADLTAQYAATHQPVVPGAYVMLAVSDTGTGMTPEVKAKIFEPFFTTKERGKGTGLGLSTVYGIVKQSGGYVWVYSEAGRGTTFKIYLPRVNAPAQELVRPKEAGGVAGTETILLAEDDPMLRPLAKSLLEKLGYTVLEAANADEALATASARKGRIHLLVADVVMPGASGRDLARQLAKTRPDTKVLYVSGYTDDAIIHHGMLEPGLNFLQKPFTPAVLARKVREVLDAK